MCKAMISSFLRVTHTYNARVAAKEGAAGSIPVSRFFFYIFRSFLCLYIYMENLKIKTLS